MQAILSNYNFDPEWLKDYTLEVTMYDRSDDGVERDLTQYGKVFKTQNMGDVDFDKLSWLIENYDNLPDVFLWSKTNIFKFVYEKDLKKALKTKLFTPLLKQDHRIYSDQFSEVNKYVGTKYGLIYAERNDNWLLSAGLDMSGRFRSFNEWAAYFGLPTPNYIPFAPGGSYILTKDVVHKHSKDLYEGMRDALPYAKHPIEAHFAERSYFLMWK